MSAAGARIAELRAIITRLYPLKETIVTAGGREWRLSAVDLDDLLRALGPHPDVDTFPHGLLLWPAAFQLAERLAEEPNLVRGKRVLEIGSGVGLPGLVASALGATVRQTDYQEEAIALTELNALENGIATIRHFQADWRTFPREEVYDVILGSDVLHRAALRPTLAALFTQILAPNGILIMAERTPPHVAYFGERLTREGWQIATESRLTDWEGYDQEIALLFASRSGVATKGNIAANERK